MKTFHSFILRDSPESASPYVSYFISDDSEEQIVGRGHDDVRMGEEEGSCGFRGFGGD
jgi:hypothetical protein